MFKRLCSTALIFGMAAIAPPAQAQSIICKDRTTIVQELVDTHHETQRGINLRSHTQVLELWASADSGTWTVISTRANGISCIMSHGQSAGFIEKSA